MKERKLFGYWKSIENVVVEVTQIMEKEGWEYLPCSKILANKGHAPLAAGITRYHDWDNVRRILGKRLDRKKAGYWKNFNNVVVEGEQILKENDWNILPGVDTLTNREYNAFVAGVFRYHNWDKVRKALGEKIKKKKNMKPPRYWQNMDNVLAECEKAMEENGWEGLPGTTTLKREGYNTLVSGVERCHKWSNIRKILGQEQHGKWKRLDYVLDYTKNLMREKGWMELPTVNELKKEGHGGLYAAIYRYHGGLLAFRAKLNEYLGRKTEREQLEGLLRRYAN